MYQEISKETLTKILMRWKLIKTHKNIRKILKMI